MKRVRDFWLALIGLGALACQPEIGDACSTSSDCSVSEQRTCDTTFPAGYCTRFGCSAGDCPEEAACIGFRNVISSAPECASLQERPRLQRTACLRQCSRDRDCRSGYVCVDMALPNPWGATVIEYGGGTKVCTLPPPAESHGEAAICSPLNGSAGPPPLTADAGALRVDAGSDAGGL